MIYSNSYEIARNGYRDRNLNEMRNVIIGLQLWETFSVQQVEQQGLK